MDDFLYNLRRETDKRNRRQSGQQQYRGPDRRGPNSQRRSYQRRNESLEQSAEIKSLLEAISENQKQLIENDSRKIRALEDIADALQSMIGTHSPNKIIKSVAVSEPAEKVETAEAVETAETVGTESVVVADDAPKVSADKPEPDVETAKETQEKSPKTPADTGQSKEKPLRSTHEEIRKISLSLREQGKTYKEIAQYLDDQKIPTFSGKGGWHAPTIHKLCK